MSRYDPLTPATPYLGLVCSAWPVMRAMDRWPHHRPRMSDPTTQRFGAKDEI